MTLNNRPFWTKSETGLWSTPQKFFDELDKEFGFQVDVCANKENYKCKKFFTQKEDGLAQSWVGVCWMNHPYGREISRWMEKAYKSSLVGAQVVCLVPSRTDTKWWHNWAMRWEIRFIKGRLKFGKAKWSAPFPSAIVIFKDKTK